MKRVLISVLVIIMLVVSTISTWGAVAGFGARAIGMGGAYTAIADDEYSAYWNPAGITNTQHVELPAGLAFLGDFDKVENIFDKVSDKQLPDREDLNQNYSLEGYLGFETKYFGLSAYTDSQILTTLDAIQNVELQVGSYNYGILTIASKIGEQWAIGANLKNVFTGSGDANLPVDLSKQATLTYYSGSGTACDIGVLYKLNSQVNIGLTARNIYNHVTADTGNKYTYSYNYATQEYEEIGKIKLDGTTIKLPQSYVLGIAYIPYETGLFAVDVETITDSYNDQTRFHFGFEQTALWKTVALRMGCFTNKDDPLGYTAGLGLKLWIFYTNLAMVSVDSSKEYVLSGSVKF